MELDIAWDRAKAEANRAKHGVSFAQAASVLTDPMALTLYDREHGRDEDRWFTVGLSSDGKWLAVAHTFAPTGADTALVRIISAREATRREREHYRNRASIGDAYGPDRRGDAW